MNNEHSFSSYQCNYVTYVRRRRTPQMLINATYRWFQWAQPYVGNATQHAAQIALCGMLHLSPYGDTVCVKAAVEINVLDYNVAVRKRTAPYVMWTGFYTTWRVNLRQTLWKWIQCNSTVTCSGYFFT